MAALDATIDELYRLPLNEFTGARNALAKSLTGGDAKHVRALAKPTVVPWAVNQVYWRARGTYDRLMKSGEKLRAAQIAALEGRAADVRAAADAHRRAVGDAVAEAQRLAAPDGARPGADALARTFESLSLATAVLESPGRLTDALQPAGFEALTGITPQPAALSVAGRTHGSVPTNVGLRSTQTKTSVGAGSTNVGPRPAPSKTGVRADPTNAGVRSGPANAGGGADPRVGPAPPNAQTKARRAAEARREAAAATRAAAEQKTHEAAVKEAEAELARVEGAERDASDVWERAHDTLLSARQALTVLRRSRFRSS